MSAPAPGAQEARLVADGPVARVSVGLPLTVIDSLNVTTIGTATPAL